MKLTVYENNVPMVLFISVWWMGAAEPHCLLIMKTNDSVVKINTIDVTKDFFDGKPSPLQFTSGFKPLPEAPKHVFVSQTYQRLNATITWIQRRGFRSTLLKFYLMKLVNEKEVHGVPMRYTQYLLHGPVPSLTGKKEEVFSYTCLNLTNSFKIMVSIWSLGQVNLSSASTTFLINKYSGAEITFKPETEHDIQRIKQQYDIDRCICDSEIYISADRASQSTISIHNDGRTIPVDIHLVSKRGKIKRKLSLETDRFMNKTDIKLSRAMTRKVNQGFKLLVIKRCGSPEYRTHCGKMIADIVTRSNSNEIDKQIGTEQASATDPHRGKAHGIKQDETGFQRDSKTNKGELREHKRIRYRDISNSKLRKTRRKRRKKGRKSRKGKKKKRIRNKNRRIKHQRACRNHTKWSRTFSDQATT